MRKDMLIFESWFKVKDYFKCDKCEDEFDSNDKFEDHKSKVLCEENEFVCVICDKHYIGLDIFKIHKYEDHNNEKSIHSIESRKCPLCYFSFKIKRHWVNHIKVIHKRPHICVFCEKFFCDQDVLFNNLT